MLELGATITVVKEAASAAKAAGKIDLYEKFVDLHSTINALHSESQEKTMEIQTLRDENAELDFALKFSGCLTFNGAWYLVEDDPFPFCPNCWESKKTAIHLGHSSLVGSGERRDCRNCKQMFIDASKAQHQAPPRMVLRMSRWAR